MLYDPVKRHQAIEKLVTREGSQGKERKYYRFRQARWYGGIVTADCVGCGLLCRFCWVKDNVMIHPADVGEFYTPDQVAKNLIALAETSGLKQLRISGGEPTIGKAHLLKLLERLRGRPFTFILETNGIPVACDSSYAEDLSKFSCVHVRVSLKGCSKEEFSRLTGAEPKGFELQLDALSELENAGVSCHPSVMTSFSTKEKLGELTQMLRHISPGLAERIEIEELILYPRVVERLKRYALRYTFSHEPGRVPEEQI